MIRRAAFFALVYFLQGAVLAYFTNFQKPFLAEQKVSAPQIGLLTSLLLLPFIFKIVFGLISDRLHRLPLRFLGIRQWGGRKSLMGLGLIFSYFGFLQAGRTSPGLDFLEFGIWVGLASLGIALFDSAADGLALDSSRESEHGVIQGAMMGGKSMGLILLSFAMGSLVLEAGYAGVFNLLSLMCIGGFVLVVFGVRESLPVSSPSAKGDVRNWAVFLSPRYLIFALFALVYSACSFGIDGIISLTLARDLHLTAEEIGRAGALRGMGAVTGAGLFVLGSRFVRLERISILASAGIILGGLILGFVLGGKNSLESVYGSVMAWGVLWSFQEVAYITWAMRMSLTGWEAASFALLMALSNLGTGLGDGVATAWMSEHAGALTMTGLAALSFFPLLIWCGFLFQVRIHKAQKNN